MIDIKEHIILRGLVGSQAYGATNASSEGDRDEMGVYIEPPIHVCGLQPLDHVIQRSKPDGVRGGPGDLDLTLYSLRKFCGLAVKGNPSILQLLWLPGYLEQTHHGKELVALRPAFVSKEAGERFLGYLCGQRAKMLGERAHTVNRPDLVAAHGYDTKFAMHAVRLGFEGVQYLIEQRLSYPSPDVDVLLDIRNGRVGFDRCVQIINETEQKLRKAIASCTIKADVLAVENFLIKTHLDYWRIIGANDNFERKAAA